MKRDTDHALSYAEYNARKGRRLDTRTDAELMKRSRELVKREREEARNERDAHQELAQASGTVDDAEGRLSDTWIGRLMRRGRRK